MTANTNFKPLNRYFNRLKDCGEYYEKSSFQTQKLKEEFTFLSTIPDFLQKFYPAVSNFQEMDNHASYHIARIPTQDMSHLLIDQTKFSEDTIIECLDSIREYLSLAPIREFSPSFIQKSIHETIIEKNLIRVKALKELQEYPVLNDICKTFGHSSVEEYCFLINGVLDQYFNKELPRVLYYSHGDLCFSNIIFWKKKPYFIDPKGYLGDIENTYRVMHYDLAKLSQSILGAYDLINHELFEIEESSLRFCGFVESEKIKLKFTELVSSFGIDLQAIRLLEASFFLSLIPYHKESLKKMKGFLINSIRIFENTDFAIMK